jgi:hypothetical protein
MRDVVDSLEDQAHDTPRMDPMALASLIWKNMNLGKKKIVF